MQNKIMVTLVLAFNAMACERKPDTATATPRPLVAAAIAVASTLDPTPISSSPKRLFLDVHELGPGKVTAQTVAGAHQKDLATESKYGVDFKAYWLNATEGKIYCLAEAPSAEALNAVHKEAHGLLADRVSEVTADNGQWVPTPGMKLYLDVHHLGPGKVDAQVAADAHRKDLALQAKYHVKYLNYWLDAESGTIHCLSEAPNAQAALAVHKEAHGLMPNAIEEVSEGR